MLTATEPTDRTWGCAARQVGKLREAPGAKQQGWASKSPSGGGGNMDGVRSPSECSRNSHEFLNPQSRRFFCCRCCGGRVAHGRRPSFVSCSRSPWRGRLPPGEQPAGTGSGNVCVCASVLWGARTDLSLTSRSMTISEGRGHQMLRRVGLTQLCPRLPGQVARLPGARALPELFSRGPVGCSPWCGSSAAELLWGSREAAPCSA